MRFQDCTKNERAWFIVGAALVVVGIVALLGAYFTWWTFLFVWVRRILRIMVPAALVAAGIYVVWATRHNKFKARSYKGAPSQDVLMRSAHDVRIAGVCGGIAQYFGIESTVVRAIAALLAFASPQFTIVIYLVLVLALHRAPM